MALKVLSVLCRVAKNCLRCWNIKCCACRPPGVFEFPNFAKGTKSMMDAVVAATGKGATSIIGKSWIHKYTLLMSITNLIKGYASNTSRRIITLI